MKKIYILLCLTLSLSVGYSQNPTLYVEDELMLDETDLDARVYYPKLDLNDNLCSLIKVEMVNTPNNPLTLEVGGLGVVDRVEKESGEVWFYVPSQVKNLRFKCAGYKSLAAIPVNFKEGTVYRITLAFSAQLERSNGGNVGVGGRKPDHLTFKGVPIKGSLGRFVKRMEEEGFSRPLYNEGWATMEGGSFAGLDGCDLSIYTIGKRSTVYSVCVRFTSQDTWNELYYNYAYLKIMLTQKYGEPAMCVEDIPIEESLGDEAIFDGIRKGDVIFMTTYEMPEGFITLCIESIEYRNYNYVTLTYTDRTNSTPIREGSAQDDL